jgi:hypothetical protein
MRNRQGWLMARAVEFSLIREIAPESQDTWQNKAFLTIDVEWSCDSVLRDSIDLVEDEEVPTTWFVTHNTHLLDRLRSNPLFELGIHPNFNPLLDGETGRADSAIDIVDRLMQVVPGARSVRSHSLTSSSRLQEVFRSVGLTHELNSQRWAPLSPESWHDNSTGSVTGKNGRRDIA